MTKTILRKADYDEIRRVVKEEVSEQLDIKQFATKEDLITFKSEILAAINKKDENDAAHKMLHHNIAEDIPKLKRDVKHLFEKLEIPQPAY